MDVEVTVVEAVIEIESLIDSLGNKNRKAKRTKAALRLMLKIARGRSWQKMFDALTAIWIDCANNNAQLKLDAFAAMLSARSEALTEVGGSGAKERLRKPGT